MQGKVEICGVNTARLPRLDGKETELLLQQAHAGDRAAREKLISGNLRLVLSVIQKFSGRGENPDDLFQVGCVGLIKAIDNFDPDREVRFSTYGVPMRDVWRKNRRENSSQNPILEAIMTRKQALSAAMERIRALEMDEEEKTEILDGLQLCVDELPFAHWSEAAILDACDEFLLTHPYIRLKDFDHAGLPSHTVIRRRFGMTAQEFREKYYPITDVTTRSPYFERSVAEWNERFREEYRSLGCPGQERYNRERDKALPTWNTLAKMNGVHRWSELLRLLDLKKNPATREYRVTVEITLE